MKRLISIFAIAVLLASLNSCRQEDEEIMNIPTVQKNVNKSINDTTKGCKPALPIDYVDPPVRDGQQWKIRK